MPTAPEVLLLDEAAVLQSLQLGQEDLAWLVSTGQLTPVTIRSKRRFLAREIEALIKVYQSTQHRQFWN